ncbi:phosphodiester glycosidase family protein [Pontibacter sp. G13]|uniref:phosphodiester glycosidase family protein n=1 Tax=Pontibacter sp. G13 TaxID=3074898 RepID=UPI00288A29A6|nr:phosphodiester glycosidase family protein [Pontibacter sp. G13]WNJ18401.1 phosphodiester glycosidase family protein [Pontibacter sp. G13]
MHNVSSHVWAFFLIVSGMICCSSEPRPVSSKLTSSTPDRFIAYTVDPALGNLKMYWKDPKGQRYAMLGNLVDQLAAKGQKVNFAMNGGMFRADGTPQGLFIESGTLTTPLDTVEEAYGNFYLQPNGIFYLTHDHRAVVCQRSEFPGHEGIEYATQSGPMLVIQGKIHPAFREGSSNVHFRNGVGILPDGKVLFAISSEEVNLWDFAQFFRSNGCENALYLDGFVSRMYAPAKNWEQRDGKFGVIIAEVNEM